MISDNIIDWAIDLLLDSHLTYVGKVPNVRVVSPGEVGSVFLEGRLVGGEQVPRHRRGANIPISSPTDKDDERLYPMNLVPVPTLTNSILYPYPQLFDLWSVFNIYESESYIFRTYRNYS